MYYFVCNIQCSLQHVNNVKLFLFKILYACVCVIQVCCMYFMTASKLSGEDKVLALPPPPPPPPPINSVLMSTS